MRPETKKLIEENNWIATWPDSQFGDREIIWLSDLQKIIDCETKALHEELEKVRDLANKYHDEKEELENLQDEMKGNAYSLGRADAEQELCIEENSLRDEFAMRAPKEIPEWFPKSKAVDARTVRKISDRERYFKWRWYYADEMMKERGLGNQISTNFKSFIANCEDIPDDIKKVIDKEFFNML